MPQLSIPKQYRCEICIDGKIHHFGHKKVQDGVRMQYLPGVCIHTDHSGPYASSVGGARYSQLYLDRGSGHLWAFRQKKKTDHYETTPLVFTDSWGISGRKPQILQTDGDGVFVSSVTRSMLEAEKVRHEWSAPYDSNTNSFIERARRTVFEGVCTSLLRSGAPARFWGEAENHKIYTINILPTVADPDNPGKFCSRRNLLEGSRRPANLDKLVAFGTAATCYVPKEKRQGGKEPAQRRSMHGVILGYSDTSPTYRVWDLQQRCIKLCAYNFVILHEGYYPFKDKNNWVPEFFDDPASFAPTFGGVLTMPEWRKYHFDKDDIEEVLSQAPDLVVARPDPEMPTPEKRTVESVSLPSPDVRDVPALSTVPATHEPISKNDYAMLDEEEIPLNELKRRLKASMHGAAAPAISNLLDINSTMDLWGNLASVEEVKVDLSDPFAKPISIAAPETLRQAKLSPWWSQYHKAAKEELEGHEKSKTWVLVPKSSLPKTANILRGKWVFCDKRAPDGRISRFKARYVAMGFTQKEGVDYFETFAGVMIGKSFRTLLVILNDDPNFEMDHWDVKMAFTQADLEEEIFMYQPQDFEKDGENFVCKLLKSLYGLKQAAKNWADLTSDLFQAANFAQLSCDPCIHQERGRCNCCLSLM